MAPKSDLASILVELSRSLALVQVLFCRSWPPSSARTSRRGRLHPVQRSWAS